MISRMKISSRSCWNFLLTCIIYAGVSESATHRRGRELQLAGFEEVTYSTLSKRCLSPDCDLRHRARRSSDFRMSLHFEAFGKTLKLLSLQKAPRVLHPNAIISIVNGQKSSEWKGKHPDCFLTGHMDSEDSTVSISHCDQMIGGIRTKKYTYHFEEIENDANISSNQFRIIVARKRHAQSSQSIRPPVEISELEDGHERTKRQATTKNITIEMAAYTDAAFTALFGTDDVHRRIALLMIKYNGVQMEYARKDMLDYIVKIQIKKITFFEKNPSWYNDTTKLLGGVLSTFCEGTMQEEPYDHMYMHTGLTGMDVTGRAYQSSMCVTRYRCGTDVSTSFTDFVATAHEMGHNIGMYHDADRGCNGTNRGNMGGYGAGWSTCSRDDMDAYLQKKKAQCVFEENVPTSNALITSLENVESWSGLKEPLMGLPGIMFTGDEFCQMRYGQSFKYRNYPLVGECSIYSCVNHDVTSSQYGQMFKQHSFIPGLYCGPSMVCFAHGCKNASEARQYKLETRMGGWSQWGEWSGCSRTCGNGLNFRRRTCTNPTPKNNPTCEGNEYDAFICGSGACENDVTDVGSLKTQRANESCINLINTNVINSTHYLPSGKRFSYKSYGQCEVRCDPVPGYKPPGFTRFGLMPQGTPCDGEDVDYADIAGLARRPGFTYMCIDGQCGKFGCDNLYNGASYDECGECGGSGNTCDYTATVYTKVPGKGKRKTIVILPEGSYNILFSFKWGDMKQHYLEVWTMDDTVVLASYIPSSWVWNTKDKPVVYNGTSWHYVFSSQFLSASGPLKTPVQIKLFQNKAFTNKGITYGFSETLPKSIQCTFEKNSNQSLNQFCNWKVVGWYITDGSNVTFHVNDHVLYTDYTTAEAAGRSATLETTSISPSSRSQCLYFRYLISDSQNVNVTVSLRKNSAVLWSLNASQPSQPNVWHCGAVSVTALETNQIVMSAVVNSNASFIALDDIYLLNHVACSITECDRYIPVITTVMPPVTTTVKPTSEFNWIAIVVVAILAIIILAVVIFLVCKARKNTGKLVMTPPTSPDEAKKNPFGFSRESSVYTKVENGQEGIIEQFDDKAYMELYPKRKDGEEINNINDITLNV